MEDNKKPVNQTNNVNNGDINKTAPDALPSYAKASVKGTFAEEEVQKALRRYLAVPELVTVKEVRKSYKPEGADMSTQKIKVMSGTSIEDAESHELSLVGIELDPVKAVNKKYRIVDYTLGLEANMSGGRFGGYAATGFKLMVTRLEEVKEGGK